MEDNAAGRRPLKSRGRWWSRLVLKALLKTSLTPNQISIASIGFACLAAAGFLAGRASPSISLLLCSVIGMQGRLLCNLMDGMLAVEGGRESKAGELFNEIPDRVSDVVILAGAGYGYAAVPVFVFDSVMLGWVAALFAVITAYVRVFGASAGAGQLFLGPMAKPHRMALLTGTCVIEMLLVWRDAYAPLVPWALLLMIFGCGITAYRRLRKIYSFLQVEDAH